MFSDAHTHLDLFTDSKVEEMIERAEMSRVELIVAVGTTLLSSSRVIEIAERYERVVAGVGLHPTELTRNFSTEDYKSLESMANQSEKVVCISETGLDYLASSPNHDWQKNSFRGHIRLAVQLGKVLEFHARESYEDIFEILRDENAFDVGVIWHYFWGDIGQARTALNLGCYLSLAKPLLRDVELENVASYIPLDRIVLETDSYPQLWKKNPKMRTEPSHVIQVAEKLAEIKGLSVGEVGETTTRNLRGVLGI